MVFLESFTVLNILVVFLILIKRKNFLEKFKKLTRFDKIFISSFLILSLFSMVISIFFVFGIPFNPFAFLPMETLRILLSIFNPFMSLLFLGLAAIKWFYPEYKSKTPKVKTEKYEVRTLIKLFNSQKVLGSGGPTDPYIIESRNIFPEVDVIKIKKSNDHIIFRNHDLKSIKIKKSSNIAIFNCNSSCLQLYNCSEVKITGCTFNVLVITNSVKITVNNSEIAYLRFFRSFLNEFEDCSIKRIDKQHSPDNVFNLKEKIEDTSRKSNVFQNHIPTIMISSMISIIIGDILIFAIITDTLIIDYLIFVPLALSSSLFVMILSFKEASDLQRKIKKNYDWKKDLRFNARKLVLGWIIIIFGLILINITYFFLYRSTLLLFSSEFIPIFLVSIVAISSLIITAGINVFIMNIYYFKENLIGLKNPLYPTFLIYNIFFANFVIFMYISSFLFIFDNTYVLLAPLTSILLLINLVISISTKIRFSKLKNPKTGIITIFSIILFGLSPITFYLMLHYLPYYVSYLGLLNFPREAFYLLLIAGLVIALALLGISSFPKTLKLFSAVNYSNKKKYTKSIKSFQSVLRSDPYNEVVLYNLGVTYYDNEEYTKSVDSLKRALRINENSVPSLIMLGYASAKLGDFETSIGACEKAIQKTQNPVVNVATKLSEMIKQSLSEPIKEERAWYALSSVYSVKKEFNKVIETANNAIKLNPKFKEAWLSLAYGYINLGEADKAIEACNSALEIDSDFAFTWSHMGLAYKLKEDFELGVQMLEKAVELSPKEHRIRLNLAKIYLDMKDYKRALESINISLQLKPNYKEAIELKEEIAELMDPERIE